VAPDPSKPTTETTEMFTAVWRRGFVLILARPPPHCNAETGRAGADPGKALAPPLLHSPRRYL